MIKSIKSKNDFLVSLGFPEKPQPGDFDYISFPSKLGGAPVNMTIDVLGMAYSSF